MIGWLLGAAAVYILKPEIRFDDPCENEIVGVIDVEGGFLCECGRCISIEDDTEIFTCECGLHYISEL